MIKNTSKNLPLAIGAIVKESPETLLEWIAYHRVVGVDFFWIADNGSEFATRQLLLDLDRLGIISYIDFPAKVDAHLQLSAYRKIFDNARGFKGLLAFIDADEFLVPDGDSLSPFMEKLFSDKNISALALNWANFGSNGALFAEEGLIIERFTRRAKKDIKPNLHFKSIVRPERVKDFINPHLIRLHQGRYVNANGQDLNLFSKNNPGMSAELSWNGARINHYIIKSLEEFLLEKHLRGDVANAKRVLHKKYFIKHDQNEEECLLATRFAPQVHAEIEHLKTKCSQLRSLIHPDLIRRYPKPIKPSALKWQRISPSGTEALKTTSLPANTAILMEENQKLLQQLEELNIFNQRLFRSLQYRLGSMVGSVLRTMMLKPEKRSQPEIRIKQVLKRFNQGRKAP